MWVSASTGIAPAGNTPVTNVFNGSNRIGTGSYDAAGNQLVVNGNALTYDAENRQVTNTSNGVETYVYDGDGRRVQKKNAAGTSTFVYDAQGRLAMEVSSAASVPACVTCYLTSDHLGSTTLVTDAGGNVIARHEFLPFGEEIGSAAGRGAQFTAVDSVNQKFTGKERDSESGLDYFGARYFGSALGRFTSPDPIWVTKERLLDPQRLNLYTYGRNNPLAFIDPDGMDVTLGTCSTGTKQECFQQLEAGLKKDDRSHVHLVQGDGRNGFKKGDYGITVDADYKSKSSNFQTLQTLAGDHSATARLDILNSNDKVDVMVSVSTNVKTGQETMGTMSMTPGQDGGFSGYTFYPYGKGVPGPYSTGDFTDVVVNASRGEVPETIQHELRHVLLGDFGRKAPYGAHGTGTVDRQTTEAEKEASKNRTQR